MSALENLIPNDGAWLPVAVLLSLVFGPYAVASRQNSDKWWAFGRAFRWVKNRKIREIEESSRLADVTMSSFEAERERVNKQHEADRSRWMKRMEQIQQDADEDRDRFRAEMQQLSDQVDAYWSYIVFTASFARQLAELAAQHGWEPPPPRLLSFAEWSKRMGRDT